MLACVTVSVPSPDRGYGRQSDVNKPVCAEVKFIAAADLQTMDALWSAASGGKFGYRCVLPPTALHSCQTARQPAQNLRTRVRLHSTLISAAEGVFDAAL